MWYQDGGDGLGIVPKQSPYVIGNLRGKKRVMNERCDE